MILKCLSNQQLNISKSYLFWSKLIFSFKTTFSFFNAVNILIKYSIIKPQKINIVDKNIKIIVLKIISKKERLIILNIFKVSVIKKHIITIMRKQILVNVIYFGILKDVDLKNPEEAMLYKSNKLCFEYPTVLGL